MCRSGCRTRDHGSWGECLRAANLTLTPADSGAKPHDYELSAYADARRQGIQPASTKLEATQVAVALSEKSGVAFDAGKDIL